MFEATIGVGAFFSLASEVRAQLDGQILRKDVGGIDVGVLNEEHSHFFPIFGRAISFGTALLCLLSLLAARWFVIIRTFGSGMVTLVTTALLLMRGAGSQGCAPQWVGKFACYSKH